MNDLISRQAAIETLWKEPTYTDPLNVLAEARDRIEALPSAEPERKKGKWIGGELGYCSCCGHKGCASDIWSGCEDGEFCPNCGADMRGEEDE